MPVENTIKTILSKNEEVLRTVKAGQEQASRQATSAVEAVREYLQGSLEANRRFLDQSSAYAQERLGESLRLGEKAAKGALPKEGLSSTEAVEKLGQVAEANGALIGHFAAWVAASAEQQLSLARKLTDATLSAYQSTQGLSDNLIENSKALSEQWSKLTFEFVDAAISNRPAAADNGSVRK